MLAEAAGGPGAEPPPSIAAGTAADAEGRAERAPPMPMPSTTSKAARAAIESTMSSVLRDSRAGTTTDMTGGPGVCISGVVDELAVAGLWTTGADAGAPGKPGDDGAGGGPAMGAVAR
jgi:hypothetical protein